MRRFSYVLLFIFLILSSCMEKEEFSLNQYVKVLSLDRSSFAEKILELENGDLLVVGEIGVSAFEFESTGQGSEPNELEDQAPFLAITDNNGNLKNLRMYPIEDFELAPPFDFIEILNVKNRTTFVNAIPTSDGGFLVHALVQGFDFLNTLNGEVITSQPGRVFYNDLLIKLDELLNIEKIQSVQGQPGWDGVNRFRGNLKRIGPNDIGFLLSQRTTFILNGDLNSKGCTFLQFTDALDTIQQVDLQRSTDFIGQDFEIDGSGQFSLLATTESTFELFQSPVSAITIAGAGASIASDGVLGTQNTDENYLKRLSDGTFIAVYTDPPTGIRMQHLAADFSLISGPHEIGVPDNPAFANRATRAVTVTKGDAILIYVLNIPNAPGMNLSGELFKVSASGELYFANSTEGVPGDVIETADGSIITTSNAIYNGSLQKIHITKMNANGELF